MVGIGLVLAISAGIASCDDGSKGTLPSQVQDTTVSKARCGIEDSAETALQGQVPAALRRLGAFAGFHCNLVVVSQSREEGAGWQNMFLRDSAGHLCAYYDTSPEIPGREHVGVVVNDATSPTNVRVTDYLTTPAMIDPMETLKVNEPRQLLAAVHSIGEKRHADIELYDLSADCRFPRLLTLPRPIPRPPSAPALRSNEGDFSPDGLTYYATNLRDGIIDVIDITDPADPKVLAEWSMPFNQRTSGLAISAEGSRAYFTLYGQGAAAPTSSGVSALSNGLVIADVSEVQARKPNPQPKVVSSIVWGDGSASHQIVPVTIKGTNYLISTDEGGSGYANTSGWRASCNAGLPAWSMARIIDISNEKHPRIVAKLQLEMNNPRNCSQVLPDLVGRSGFTYGSHYCSVDDSRDATAMACSYFESGIRVFDIRDPARPKEIAYFVPPSVTSPSPGSLNSRSFANGRPDHCSAQVRFDKRDRTLMTTCQDNGLLVLKFTNGAWPSDSTN